MILKLSDCSFAKEQLVIFKKEPNSFTIRWEIVYIWEIFFPVAQQNPSAECTGALIPVRSSQQEMGEE